MLTHAKMYEIGDKYCVLDLKDLAEQKFCLACAQHWNTPSFAVAAHHTLSTTVDEDAGLGDIVSSIIAEHMKITDEPAIRTLLIQFNGLAMGILDGKRKEHGWSKKN